MFSSGIGRGPSRREASRTSGRTAGLRRPPRYRACPVDAYRDHLCARRPVEPGVPVLLMFAEIAEFGYIGAEPALQVRQPVPPERRPDRALLARRASRIKSQMHGRAGFPVTPAPNPLGLALDPLPPQVDSGGK